MKKLGKKIVIFIEKSEIWDTKIWFHLKSCTETTMESVSVVSWSYVHEDSFAF